MKKTDFSLQPFGISPPGAPWAITGTISRRGTSLAITYNLTGRLQDLVIAEPAAAPARHWLLWETTCFELFLAIPGKGPYWEINLSPAGHWNVFRLPSYRQGIAEEPTFQILPVEVQRAPATLRLSLTVDLAPIIPASAPLEVGISAVLEHQDGSLSYWALKHPADQPDFHHPQGFSIKL